MNLGKKFFFLLLGLILLSTQNAHPAKKKDSAIRDRFISDQVKFKILKEHFKEGTDIESACLECHDEPPQKIMPAGMGTGRAGKEEGGVDLEEREISSTADHRQFEILKQKFRSGPEVTAACLSCHTEASRQMMKTSHWTWICPKAMGERLKETGKGVGKSQVVVNNFCIALASNEARCTSCHAGYGWKDKDFNFSDETLVDCLVCHDTTKTYKKFPTGVGHPVYKAKEWPKGSGKIWQPPNLSLVAQNVGKSSRHTCGSCHFWGGGGEGVKHGDLDPSLEEPTHEIDVHMDAEDLNFSCAECHTTRKHQIAGRCFTIPAYQEREQVMKGREHKKNHLPCESCHSENPHHEAKLNHHTDKVACQSCHVPTFSRTRPTKMWWDWSKAGQLDENGKPFRKKTTLNGASVVSYDSKKGAFLWAVNEVPEYRWFNGEVDHTFLGDPIDDTNPGKKTLPVLHDPYDGKYNRLDFSQPVVQINQLKGSYKDPKSRIWPVKIHRGKQPYDPIKKSFVVPKLFGQKGSGAFWAEYDWGKSIEAGMRYVETPYSGKYDFIQTEMHWPISHMVAPEKEAVSCTQCHNPKGRLSHLSGFYMPGRDSGDLFDWIGLCLVLGSLGGAGLHGALRMIVRRRRRKQEER